MSGFCSFLAGLALFCGLAESRKVTGTAAGDCAELTSLFKDFREFQKRGDAGEALADMDAAMKRKYRELKTFQGRLAAIDPSRWPVSEQIDYHLVRAEMNGLEFELRVLRPWARDPAFYGGRRGELGNLPSLPLEGEQIAEFRTRLQAIPEYYEQAKKNLGGGNIADIPGDLAILAIHHLETNDDPFPRYGRDSERRARDRAHEESVPAHDIHPGRAGSGAGDQESNGPPRDTESGKILHGARVTLVGPPRKRAWNPD
jgi:hypothetical protein